ncbi:SDR family oxidoreductase [Duganella violaceipulchra]|uniref:NAD(P)-dependent dehydrogenase (Short-subunit alcohol dehydrogenase family) n=1 Tax=Duganella violaceipulchra TaxID=2849652 RepID=A0AA41H9N8_9BURK|nr:SDR family oxidoreductase [Duganella violaceicalia]MBV6320837.1 SDR family oxidoreductase [Duganella violaceicalia]MCP2008452.1 NAD(P)-dependent dehydrogenase (short-subunit alcohol dehydrogenase family) [Duganella violaceicalia]
MATALIIGASRGIGLELVRQYLADGWRVIATARKAEHIDALAALGAEAHGLDVTNVEAVAGLGWKLDGEELNVAILNAGVYGPRHDGFPLQTDFDTVMHTNVLAAMRLLPIIAPMVCATRGKLAVLSSKMGSLSERANPTGSLYRASKAALNSVLIDTALSFGKQGATCVALHPGWVRTDMGGGDADLPVEQSAAGIRATLAALPASEQAVYRNYDGTSIGW